jgi:hypothetical protein
MLSLVNYLPRISACARVNSPNGALNETIGKRNNLSVQCKPGRAHDKDQASRDLSRGVFTPMALGRALR